ncbi:MAG: RtcB family protein [Planctomycetota bacterium]
MNKRDLLNLGIDPACVSAARRALKALADAGRLEDGDPATLLREVIADPAAFTQDRHRKIFARALIDHATHTTPRHVEPIAYQTWGRHIEDKAHGQMRDACRVPSAVGAALMPDAHLGYGLPIGGVLATEGTVIPYAVGVDIACRMKISVLDLPTKMLDESRPLLGAVLEQGTVFGAGREHEKSQDHPVLDADWRVSPITIRNKNKARRQLGTSGSGNHFVEFGRLTVGGDDAIPGLDKGEYVALMSHSGSRGPGAAVCKHYSKVATQKLRKGDKEFERLAWLDLDSEAGQEYWAAMNLMGDYAAANHDVIHRLVSSIVGGEVLASVENHHNFAWIEEHGGKELVVHRKGATPAGAGVLGVIPGSMASPAYVVRGKGQPQSMNSAAHGAGRVMSRTQAKKTFNYGEVVRDLRAGEIDVISAGADEVPGVYKDIDTVMSEQADLVETVARFDPKVVKMCGDGSRAED